jgi:hypothetical protein
MGKIKSRVAIALVAVVDLTPYATKDAVAQTYATKTEMQDNLREDAAVKKFVQDLAAAETAEYGTIRADFEALQNAVKEINDDLAVQETINESLAGNGYLSDPK